MRLTSIRILTLLLMLGGGIYAPGQRTDAPPRRGLPPQEPQRTSTEIKSLIDDALVAPAEFSADALIRIAESDRVASPSRKLVLLEEAFRQASEAQQPVRRTYIGGDVDTRAGYLSHAFNLRVDALSLQTRAVRAMLSVDKRKARELFGEIAPKLRLRPLGCEDALVYDVSEFYETLQEIALKAFSPAEQRRDEHIYFIQSYIEEISSPVQVAPVARIILALRPSLAQLPMLLSSFNKALRRVSGDDRAFSFSMGRNRSAVASIFELVKASAEHSPSLRRELLQAFRAYLVNNLGGSRCADSVEGQFSEGVEYVEAANNLFNFERLISAEEMKPKEILSPPNNHPYWQTPEARKLLAEAQKLRFSPGGGKFTPAERESADWQLQLTEFLNDVAEWGVEKEKSEADYFHQKSVLLQAVLDLTPEGVVRDKVLREYVYFLRDSPMQRENRLEWLLHVSNLIKKAHQPGGTTILAALNNSENGNLRLYANLAKLLPPQKTAAELNHYALKVHRFGPD